MGNSQTSPRSPRSYGYSDLSSPYGEPYRLLMEYTNDKGPMVIGLFDEYNNNLEFSLYTYFDDSKSLFIDLMIDTIRYPIYDKDILCGVEARERVKSKSVNKTRISGVINVNGSFKYVWINLSSKDKFIKGSVKVDEEFHKFTTLVKVLS